mgnify:CR=1 FL=1
MISENKLFILQIKFVLVILIFSGLIIVMMMLLLVARFKDTRKSKRLMAEQADAMERQRLASLGISVGK